MNARIVFDLDGTLIDSAPDIHGIANAILSEEGQEPISLAQARDFIGNGASVFVQKMRAARSIPEAEHPRLLASFIRRYDHAVMLTLPYPGVVEALAALTAKGHRLGVCTNKPIRPTRAVLAHLGLDRWFGTVWGGDSLPVHKPDPAPLHAAFEALGDGPRLYVGDSDVDAETAQRAEVPFLLFTEGYRKVPVSEMHHDVPFDDFATLPALVERLLASAA
ncbi:phosphoglycolate phosphatase [Thetidibacter halocola]|uniref:Phosphoglycolate phosphatase n=1 Tax=Thetidibacter halocola TaxID=2827239 RepID=A0A8J7WE30_9RHOB|nr:phosphoglycolate phosphatase [Thetidibacter halocola]MBS0124011.1 phosphoglycolate phosphatase [Thetidibacter halocola]